MNKDIEIKHLLGKRIKEIRKQRNYTQEQFAELIGICERNLSKIECGCNFVTAGTLSKIVSALGIEPKELFDFFHNNDIEILKQELLEAIKSDKIDVRLMYRFYQSIK